MKRYWTGVGSRNVPDDVVKWLVTTAKIMNEIGFTLRSGGAEGSDTIFADQMDKGLTQIWHPWKGFGKRNGAYNSVVISDRSFAEARDFYLESGIIPWFDKMKQGAQKLHARNYYQVVGKRLLGEPLSEVCIYYVEMDKNLEPKGGTRSAVMVARHYGVPCYNLGIQGDRDRLDAFFQRECLK